MKKELLLEALRKKMPDLDDFELFKGLNCNERTIKSIIGIMKSHIKDGKVDFYNTSDLALGYIRTGNTMVLVEVENLGCDQGEDLENIHVNWRVYQHKSDFSHYYKRKKE